MYLLEEDALDQDRIFKQPVCNKAIIPGCTPDVLLTLVADSVTSYSFRSKKLLPKFISVE